MTSPSRTFSVEQAARHIEESCSGRTSGQVGLEMEWLTYVLDDPSRRPHPDTMRAAAARADLPGGSRITFEPGGQLELSSPPASRVGDAIGGLADDARSTANALAALGVAMVGLGRDPVRREDRVVSAPRYDAMEGFFAADGASGRTMMCNTASLQVNLDACGDEADVRWRRAHRVAPVLAATFACSPLVDGAPTGWKSSRLLAWSGIDPSRTSPALGATGSCLADWTAYALAARVMCIRVDEHTYVPLTERISFGRWVAEGHELGWPTVDDFAFHLTTLFPPVRLRGWLELRVVDSLPDPWWRVAAAVATALLDDAEAATRADRVCRLLRDPVEMAALHGLEHPPLAAAAAACFVAALEAFGRLGVDHVTEAAAEAFFDRFVARGRCPADDLLDAYAAGVPLHLPGTRIPMTEPLWT